MGNIFGRRFKIASLILIFFMGAQLAPSGVFDRNAQAGQEMYSYAEDIMANAGAELDDPTDNGVVGVIESDDFDTPEEHENYLEGHPSVRRMLDSEQSLRSMPTAKNAEATLKYTITGLVSPKAIQKTCINGGYIYVLQRSETTTYFSRCKIDGTTASYVDHMVLSNFGHTQTLEHYTHKNKEYFLIGCKASTADKTNWALQIGRIQYVAGKTVQYTSICRLSSLRCANKSGSSFGGLQRADAALSSNNERLVVWAKNESGDIRYSIYDFKKINNVLDTKINESSKYVSCADSPVKNACISSRTETKSGGNRFLAYESSMQGIELSDKDSIYIIGGNSSQLPEIGKMSSTGGNRALRKCTHSNFGASHSSEAEGVQLKGDYVYFGVYNSNIPKNKAGRWRIYYIPKTAF